MMKQSTISLRLNVQLSNKMVFIQKKLKLDKSKIIKFCINYYYHKEVCKNKITKDDIYCSKCGVVCDEIFKK